jgi:hypothetical protein
MGNAKPWQIAVIVIGLLAGAGMIVVSAFTGDAPRLAKSLTVVDVETGDLFEIDVGKGMISFPIKNPNNSKLSLMPVYKGDGGNWFVASRYLNDISSLAGVKPEAIDAASGKVAKVGSGPKYITVEH